MKLFELSSYTASFVLETLNTLKLQLLFSEKNSFIEQNDSIPCKYGIKKAIIQVSSSLI